MQVITAAELIAAKCHIEPSVLLACIADAVAATCRPLGQSFAILAGNGSNGAAAIEAAAVLAGSGATVTVGVPMGRPPETRRLDERGVTVLTHSSPFGVACRAADVLIDGLYGTDDARPIGDELLGWVGPLSDRSPGQPLVAINVPSGVDPDSGGADPATPRADITVTLGAPKLGQFLFPAQPLFGRVVVADCGLRFDDVRREILDRDVARALVPFRPINGTKGTFGRVMVIGGSERMVGQVTLTANAALRVGVGLVSIATPRSVYSLLAGRLAEPHWLPLPEEAGHLVPAAVEPVLAALDGYDAVAIGPGIGDDPASREFVRDLLSQVTLPIVVDSYGLNALAPLDMALPPKTVLMPHAGEASALLRWGAPHRDDRRVEAAETIARHGAVVVMKRAHSFIAAPDGRLAVPVWANPSIATAGTGDALAGVIAGFLAQQMAAFDAARLAVALHAEAADRWTKRNMSANAGLLASDLIAALPAARAFRD